ncbi:MAG: response regulator [Proteobacteria bacterium]|nr:MAG: response regulator [Pseudomonadota bacterium]
MSKHILILEDDQSLAQSLAQDFRDHGYQVSLCKSAQDIPDKLFDFALVDLRLSRGELGLDAIEKVRSSSAGCRIVVLTGYGSISTAVEAVKRGAVDYITKPASFRLIESALLGTRESAEADLKAPSLSQVEHEYIDFLLTKNNGNISKTAKALGLHRQSLQRKLKKYT